MASFPGKGSQTGSRGAAATRYTATPPATRPHFASPLFQGSPDPAPGYGTVFAITLPPLPYFNNAN